MKVALALALTIFVWGFYPLLSVWILETTDPFSMMLIVQFAAFHGALFFSLLCLWQKGQLSNILTLHKQIEPDNWITIIIAGACSAFSHIFFIYALQMANKNGISLIYDTWPLFALFLAPQMIDKPWEKAKASDYIIGVVALGGVAMVVLSDENINWFRVEEFDFMTLFAYVLVVAATYMTAILNLFRTQFSQTLKQTGLKGSFSPVMLSEMYARIIAVLCILITIFIMQLDLDISYDNLGLMIFIGVGIFSVGGGAFTYALLKAKTPNVSLFFYLVPILAVFWLVYFGESQITALMIIGGAITVLACTYLMYDNSKPKES